MEKKDNLILKMTLDQLMADRFGRYSKYIIQNRALPDARDGLKPVQRRILFAMEQLNLTWNKSFKKSARIVGEVIGKYHPHGDTSIYEAMVRMSQSWKMNVPLIEMHGNNGSIDDDPAAAMRYTEVRLEKVSDLLLKDIDKNTVSFAPNFDDSEREPTVLPALLPNLLLNGAKGIAAGYATEMPPHNLNEVIDALIAKINSPNIRLNTLMNYIKGPDFPTGGIIQGKNGIFEAFERGRGRIVVKSKYEIIDLKTKAQIIIKEIPYGVIKAKLVKQLDEIRFQEKVPSIKDVRDESDRNGIAIVIDLKTNKNIKNVLAYLLSKTEMLVYYNYNNIAINNLVPKQMSLNDLLETYLTHQDVVQKKALNFDLQKNLHKLEIVQGLIKASKNIQAIIQLITSSSEGKKGIVEKLKTTFNFTQVQANAIAELRLYRLSKTDQSIYLEEEKELKESIKFLKNILENPKVFNNFLIDKLKQIKKLFGKERKTLIENEVEKINVNLESLVKKETVWIGISQNGYLKRLSNRSYESNDLNKYFIKDNDALIHLSKMETTDKLLLFTNFGNFFCLQVSNILETKFKSTGMHINDFSILKPEEKIVSVIPVNDFQLDLNLVFITKNGKGKRVLLENFAISRTTRPYKAINLDANDFLVKVDISNKKQKIVIVTSSGKAVKYLETELSLYGLKTKGVLAIKLANNDFVQSFTLTSEEDVLGLLTSQGKGKRIKVSSILPYGKNTLGKSLFLNTKNQLHKVIDIGNVNSQSAIIATSVNEVLQFSFKSIDISKETEGFSKITAKSIKWSFIQKNFVVNKDFKLLKKQEISEEDLFKEAEEKLNKLSQLSFDDFLKNK